MQEFLTYNSLMVAAVTTGTLAVIRYGVPLAWRFSKWALGKTVYYTYRTVTWPARVTGIVKDYFMDKLPGQWGDLVQVTEGDWDAMYKMLRDRRLTKENSLRQRWSDLPPLLPDQWTNLCKSMNKIHRFCETTQRSKSMIREWYAAASNWGFDSFESGPPKSLENTLTESPTSPPSSHGFDLTQWLKKVPMNQSGWYPSGHPYNIQPVPAERQYDGPTAGDLDAIMRRIEKQEKQSQEAMDAYRSMTNDISQRQDRRAKRHLEDIRAMQQVQGKQAELIGSLQERQAMTTKSYQSILDAVNNIRKQMVS